MKDTPIVPLLIHKIKAAKISYVDGKAYTAIVLCSTDATTGKDMDLAIEHYKKALSHTKDKALKLILEKYISDLGKP